MDDNSNPIESMNELPEPKPRKRHRLSVVWAVPLVAALIGAWMAFKAYTDRGPTITISFQNAEGLEAEHTKLKYKDVEIGKVKAITLSRDQSKVVVKAELTKDASNLISENSHFWVVRARISASGISGLGTLLSGAYIAVDPGPPGNSLWDFKGLETPPIVSSREEGKHFTLQAEKLGSLSTGSPVYFRQIKVGEVAGYQLEPAGRSVSITIFVYAPYHQLVHKDTRFWNAGGMDLTLDTSGVRMSSDSLLDMLMGGVAFENPTSLEASETVPDGFLFNLYPSHDKIYEKVYLTRYYYVVNFNESVRGLSRGASVEFRGMKIGQVEDLKLEFHMKRLSGEIPVLIALEPERIAVLESVKTSMDGIMAKLVERGLRAQLKMSSLLLGTLYVDLDFYPQDQPQSLAKYGKYPEIPTIPTTMGALLSNLTHFLDRLQKLPLDKLGEDLSSMISELKETLGQTKLLIARMDKETAPQVQTTLAQAQETLATMEKLLRSDSPTQVELRQTLEELTKAVRALRSLADTLDRQPEALVWGKKKEKEKMQ